MAVDIKVLGQSAPAAATLTDLYTVPAATQTVCSSIVVCNRSNAVVTFRIAVRPSGAAIANQHYTHFDVDLPRRDTYIATIGITLDATDVVSVQGSTANLSFSLFGQENTQ